LKLGHHYGQFGPWAQFCCKMWGGQLGVNPI